MLGVYVLLFGWTLLGGRLTEALRRAEGRWMERLGWAAILVLGLFAVVVWQWVFALPDGRLRLIVLDVGNGEGLLIQTPGGRNVLVNGGSKPEPAEQRGRETTALWKRRDRFPGSCRRR